MLNIIIAFVIHNDVYIRHWLSITCRDLLYQEISVQGPISNRGQIKMIKSIGSRERKKKLNMIGMIALQSAVCSRKWVIATVCIHVHETDNAGHKVNCTYNSDLHM